MKTGQTHDVFQADPTEMSVKEEVEGFPDLERFAFGGVVVKKRKVEEMEKTAEGGERKGLMDFLGEGMKLMIVGINPGFQSSDRGHHYAGKTNLFWKLMRESGIVEQGIGFEDDETLLQSHGIGFTNLCARVTAGSDGLSGKEMREGAKILKEKIERFRPHCVLFNGIGIWRTFCGVKGDVNVGMVDKDELVELIPSFGLENDQGEVVWGGLGWLGGS